MTRLAVISTLLVALVVAAPAALAHLDGAFGIEETHREESGRKDRGVQTGKEAIVRASWLTSGLVGVLLAPAFPLGQERTWEWHWNTPPMVFMWGIGGLMMLLMMFVFWGLIIVGLVVGLRWLIGQGHPSRRDEAFEILRQRYARGEIDKQEFEARKRDLRV